MGKGFGRIEKRRRQLEARKAARPQRDSAVAGVAASPRPTAAPGTKKPSGSQSHRRDGSVQTLDIRRIQKASSPTAIDTSRVYDLSLF